jgi:hypothetical protein
MAMTWWLQVDPPGLMAVDNASISGMDFSALLATEPDLWMVHWREGRGEIERQDVENDANLNGLREVFIDIVPYAPLFQQFLTLMKAKNLLLKQAQKVQTDLIKEIFNSKRQAPYHYPVAAGDFWWDASDETMGASTALGTQNVTATVNQMAAAINQLVANINALIVNGSNANVNIGNTFIGQINSIVVANVNSIIADGINSDFSSLATEIYNGLTYQGNMTIQHINTVILGGGNGINAKLQSSIISIPGDPGATYYAAQPGLAGAIADVSYTFGPVSTYSVGHISNISPGSFAYLSQLPWTNLGNVSTSNVQWIPIGSTVAVNVTPPEQTAIINGIAQRTNDLNLKKNQKMQAVFALTDIDDVIDYDVTTGW